MGVTVSRTRQLQYFAQLRNCLPYSYGGSFTRNPNDSTDCSGLVFSAAALLVGMDPHQRYGSTETLRLARINRVAAPCGLIPAKNKSEVPRESSLKVGLFHGGGGPDSHTACTFRVDGVDYNWESRGYPGVLLGHCDGEYARAWDNPMFTDFWYLPSAGGPDNQNFFPLPQGFYYGPQDGPDESISGKNGEPQAWVERFKKWQEKAGDIPDGTYDQSTATAARKVQTANGLLPTGFVDQKTWELVMGVPPKVDTLSPAEQRELLDKVRWIADQLGPGFKEWKPQADLGKNPDGTPRHLREGLAAVVKKTGA